MTATEANVTTTEANKQTIRSLFQAMNEHRVSDLPDHIAADVTDHNKIIHGEADEPGAAFDGFAQQLVAFPDIAMAPQELIAEGGQVVVRFVASGTHTGWHPRMPQPTGRRFEAQLRSCLDLPQALTPSRRPRCAVVNAIVHAPATGRLAELPFAQVAPEGGMGVELDIFWQIGQEVAGPDSTFATELAELTLSGKNLRRARSRAAHVLRTPPRVLPG